MLFTLISPNPRATSLETLVDAPHHTCRRTKQTIAVGQWRFGWFQVSLAAEEAEDSLQLHADAKER